MLFLFAVILWVFIFEYINGFHDAANAIATVVSTRESVDVVVGVADQFKSCADWWLVWRRTGIGPRPMERN